MSVSDLYAWDVTNPAPLCRAALVAVTEQFTPELDAGEELWIFGSVLRVLEGGNRWPLDVDVCVISETRGQPDDAMREAAGRVATEVGLAVDLFVLHPTAQSVDSIVRAGGRRLA
jgi:hypothetical protein